MTQEEKAKAYEMALEAARKELGVDRKEWEVVQRVLHNVFPELAESESEDERIRKKLYNTVMGTPNDSTWFDGTSKEAMLAWLEKQKEPHKRLRDKTPWIVTAKEELAHDEECLQVNLEELRRIRAEKEKQKEQKLAWSEEDKKFFQLLHAGLYAMKVKIGKDDYDKAVERLKSLRPQPKQEWSEEDEFMRKRCIADLGYLIAYEPQYKERYDEQIDWLNSLPMKCPKTSDIWKPSEEQMDALAYAIQLLDDGLSPKAARAGEELEHLREQLKKL